MPEKDYIRAIYVIGVILILAPLVQGLVSLVAGQFYAGCPFQTAGFMMILYVAYKRFMEGWRSVKMNNDTTE